MKTIVKSTLCLGLLLGSAFSHGKEKSNLERVFQTLKTTHNLYSFLEASTTSEVDRELFRLIQKHTDNVPLPEVVKATKEEFQLEGMDMPIKIGKNHSLSWQGKKLSVNPEADFTTNLTTMVVQWTSSEKPKATLFSALFPYAHAAENRRKDDYNWTKTIDKKSWDLAEDLSSRGLDAQEAERLKVLRSFPEKAFKLLAAFGIVGGGYFIQSIPHPAAKIIGWAGMGLGSLAAFTLTSSYVEAAELDGTIEELSCPTAKKPVRLIGQTPGGKKLEVDVDLDSEGNPVNMSLKQDGKQLSKCFLHSTGASKDWSVVGKQCDLPQEVSTSLIKSAQQLHTVCRVSPGTVTKTNKKLEDLNRKVASQRTKVPAAKSNQ